MTADKADIAPKKRSLPDERRAIGVIGDFQADFPPHPATEAALGHAATAMGISLKVSWLGTLELCDVTSEELIRHDALLCAPGSPYRSLEGALRAVRLARELDWPLLGTCGGFQHMVIEYARNVLGIVDAQHAEYDPYASELFISALPCSLAGRSMNIHLAAGSLASDFYGRSEVLEHYYCDFGLNPSHQERLERGGLNVVGWDQNGEVRVVELPQLRFYLATLFVPQLRSQPGSPHPLLTAFLEAASSQQRPTAQRADDALRESDEQRRRPPGRRALKPPRLT
jgi:CTP synthase (UTP-ammonia lyase)